MEWAERTKKNFSKEMVYLAEQGQHEWSAKYGEIRYSIFSPYNERSRWKYHPEAIAEVEAFIESQGFSPETESYFKTDFLEILYIIVKF